MTTPRKPTVDTRITSGEDQLNNLRKTDYNFHNSIFHPTFQATFTMTSVKADIIRYKMTYGEDWKPRLRSYYEDINTRPKTLHNYLALRFKVSNEEFIQIPFKSNANETFSQFASRILLCLFDCQKINKEKYDTLTKEIGNKDVKMRGVDTMNLLDLFDRTNDDPEEILP